MKKAFVVTLMILAPVVASARIVDDSYHAMESLAALRSVATALDAYATDHGRYPDVKTVDDLAPFVAPTYIVTLPTKDAWGTPFAYRVAADGKSYVLASAGRDRKFDESTWNTPGLLMSSSEDAVITSKGVQREWLVQALSCH